jgi:hypothetical protein
LPGSSPGKSLHAWRWYHVFYQTLVVKSRNLNGSKKISSSGTSFLILRAHSESPATGAFLLPVLALSHPFEIRKDYHA